MINFSLEELNTIARFRKVKEYKNESEDDLTKILCESKPKINFSKLRIEEIRKKINELKGSFSKSRLKEIGRNLYEIENGKNLFAPKKLRKES